MSLAGFAFVVLAATALAAAISAAAASRLRRVAVAHAVCAAALALLSALLGAALVAVLQAAVAAATVLGLRRLATAYADDAQTREVEDAPANALPAAISVAGFLLLASRVVLMARWPLAAREPVAASSSLLAATGLHHYLMVALLLFGLGLFIVASRRSAAGVWIGIELLAGAAVLAVLAVARFVGGGPDAYAIAAAAVLVYSLPRLVLLLPRTDWVAAQLQPSRAAERSAASAMTAVAAMTLALLAGAW